MCVGGTGGSLARWREELPCSDAVLLSAQLSFLVYWWSRQKNIGLTSSCLRSLAVKKTQECWDVLTPQKHLGGLLSLPGPKTETDVHNLLRAYDAGFDLDARIALWNKPLSSVVISEPGRSRLTVVLRGTGSILDLATDVVAVPVKPTLSTLHDFPGGSVGGRVHLGFWLRLQMSGLVQSLVHDHGILSAAEVRITGHSMGGALGVLLAAELAANAVDHRDMPLTTVTTFGCPRVGNTAFSEGFDALGRVRHHRFQNGQDPVTRIPPHAPAPVDFRHTGSHVWFEHGPQEHPKGFNIGSRNGIPSLHKVRVSYARRGAGGVPNAAPEVSEPLRVIREALRGGMKGVRGHHQMGGARGYLASMDSALSQGALTAGGGKSWSSPSSSQANGP